MFLKRPQNISLCTIAFFLSQITRKIQFVNYHIYKILFKTLTFSGSNVPEIKGPPHPLEKFGIQVQFFIFLN